MRAAPLALALILSACMSMEDPTVREARADAAEEGVDCQMQLATLGGQTSGTTVTGANGAAERANLVSRLDNASQHLSRGNESEAIAGLSGYRSGVQSLKSAGTMNAAHADALIAGADAVIACLRED